MDARWVELEDVLAPNAAPLCVRLPPQDPPPTRALATLFAFGRQLIQALSFQALGSGSTLAKCFIASLGGHDALHRLIQRAENEQPICPKAPFEGTDRIAGAVWTAESHLEAGEDGIAKLEFAALTTELPMHIHECSDRAILVLRGDGLFFATNESLPDFSGDSIRAVPVSAGSLLVFGRGLPHTFAAGCRGLTLISYQSPSLPLEHRRQFSVPATLWHPPAPVVDMTLTCTD